jgi:peptidyl-prolyl cis-trans isomerase A (cyclophilin A)
MQRGIRLMAAILLVVSGWGCKKQDASPGAAEADDVAAESAEPSEATVDAEAEAPADEAPAEETPEESAPAAAAPEKSEDVYTVKLDTTKGEIIIDVHRDWAPLGAERFQELVTAGFFDDAAFFRVMKDFMAQTGVAAKPALNRKWGKKKIKDEPARKHNVRGMVSFAKAGPNSRTTQFFINLVDNTQLDAMGFAPFGQVRDMTAVDALHSGYGDGPPNGKGPNQTKLKQQGNKYLKKKFPDLDYIRTATIME